jgi:hypothetical protein
MARIREQTSARREEGGRVGRERLELLWAHEVGGGPILVGLAVAVRRRLWVFSSRAVFARAEGQTAGDSSMRHSTEDWSSACCSVTCTDGLSAKSGSLPRLLAR